jgi:DnaJ-class molecular chaperone
MVNKKSYYEILEVRDDASQEVIKMAYKALCLKYHPDTTKLDKDMITISCFKIK